MRNSFRRSWLISGLVVVVLALSLAMRTSYGKEPPSVTAPALAAPQGSSDINQVMATQDRHTRALLAIGGVVGTATTALPDGRYAVKILTQFAGLQRVLPKELEGVPVVVEKVGVIRALDFSGVTFDPVQPGGSVGPKTLDFGQLGVCTSGTIGTFVTDGWNRYILSNNHVLARDNWASIGEPIVHPGRADFGGCDLTQTNRVANLSEFVPIRFLRLGDNNSFDNPNRIDAAIAELRSGVNFNPATACSFTPSATPVAAFVGQMVKKCGRTTMQTMGTVTGINVTVVVGGYAGGRLALFTGQIQTTGMSAAGDSGSLLVDLYNRPVGLLFAGSPSATIYNPIGEVLGAFGVNILD